MIILLTGKAKDVFAQIKLMAKLAPGLTIGEIAWLRKKYSNEKNSAYRVLDINTIYGQPSS